MALYEGLSRVVCGFLQLGNKSLLLIMALFLLFLCLFVHLVY